ncbi:PspC domain-containing protein [Dysgonomonas sp. 521]|uniref:PspC domain-containing protein n=1 Tax=Dysgonomonas sp. 521 TaxID=2302932 RepID=UPI0013D6D643|nr:PspC domain-containing protein [Dysgonomonas sp. 521]NDV95174.1 PspC domain-containing protein [Dysgonomonas sp. 521]
MKPTIRVSIGGFAFNLDEDAYSVLDDYLKALKRHFENNPESSEIISDIEFRLSELLQMRVNSVDGVVSMSDALDIIKIMGSPKDFEDTAAEDNYTEEGAPKKNFAAGQVNDDSQDYFKKKLYRDAENKFIGGVCSGLGHYFKIDATVMRLIFTGIFLLLFFVAHRGPSCMVIVLIYGILWAVMPAAHSFTQKLSMSGSDPSIMNIEEDRSQVGAKRYKGSSLGSALGIMLNIFVAIIATGLFAIIIGIMISFLWLHFDTTIFGLNNYLVLLGLNSMNFKIAVLLASLLPFIGLFWLMVKILKRSSFTTQTLVGFLVGFVVWLGASFYIGNQSFKFGHSHRYNADSVETLNINTASDSLYVKLGSEYLNADTQPNNPFVLYKGSSSMDRSICILPSIKIKEDSTLTNYVVEIRKKDFADNEMAAKRKAENLRLDYTLTDSLLTINPKWYTEARPWNLELFEIVVKTPRQKKAFKESPLRESYEINSININGYDYFSHYNYSFAD